jgi:hypothetical protein
MLCASYPAVQLCRFTVCVPPSAECRQLPAAAGAAPAEGHTTPPQQRPPAQPAAPGGRPALRPGAGTDSPQLASKGAASRAVRPGSFAAGVLQVDLTPGARSAAARARGSWRGTNAHLWQHAAAPGAQRAPGSRDGAGAVFGASACRIVRRAAPHSIPAGALASACCPVGSRRGGLGPAGVEPLRRRRSCTICTTQTYTGRGRAAAQACCCAPGADAAAPTAALVSAAAARCARPAAPSGTQAGSKQHIMGRRTAACCRGGARRLHDDARALAPLCTPQKVPG